MNIYDALFTQDAIFNEQVAGKLFDTMPCHGPVVGFYDGRGNCWTNDAEGLARLNLDEQRLCDLCGRLDDGAEPVITQWNGWGVIAGEIRAGYKRCGHVIIALDAHSPEATLTKLDLAEIIFCQFNTIAKLMENQALMEELHIKTVSVN